MNCDGGAAGRRAGAAGELETDAGGVGVGGDKEIVLALVKGEIDAGVDIAITDLAVLFDTSGPVTGIGADEIVAASGEWGEG